MKEWVCKNCGGAERFLGGECKYCAVKRAKAYRKRKKCELAEVKMLKLESKAFGWAVWESKYNIPNKHNRKRRSKYRN